MDEETRQALDFLRAKVRSIEMGMVVQKNQILVTTNTHVAGTLTADNLVGVVAPGMVSHADLTNILPDDHHNQAHDFMGSDHSVSGSAGYVVGFASPSALCMFETSSNPGAASKLLKTDAAGGIEIQALSVYGNITSRHLMPEATDTYDLGSSTALWRKGWLSELDAVLFAKNTRTLVGGWLTIGKGEGALVAAAAAADTTMDFGLAMTTGQFVELRNSLAVEYVQVGSLVSGTTYNVTRNLDGTGANDWPMGAVYLIRGVSGDGLIDLNAYDSPRMSVLRQGATYNAQTETLRFGDLNGGWGFSAETWGAAFGAYASGSPNVVITPGKVALRNYNTDVISLSGSSASFEAPINLGSGGGIYQGTGTFASPTTGLKVWRDGDIGRLATYNAGTAQVYFGTDGKLYAGGGKVILDANGISIIANAGVGVREYKFLDTNGNKFGGLSTVLIADTKSVDLYCAANTTYSAVTVKSSTTSTLGDATLSLSTSKGEIVSGELTNVFLTFTDLSLYSRSNGARLRSNDGSYGAWKVDGSRNNWYGLEFVTAAGNVSLMAGHTSQTTWTGQQIGIHRNWQGWGPHVTGNHLWLGPETNGSPTNWGSIRGSHAIGVRLICTTAQWITSGNDGDAISWTQRANTYDHTNWVDDPFGYIEGIEYMWGGGTNVYCKQEGWYEATFGSAFPAGYTPAYYHKLKIDLYNSAGTAQHRLAEQSIFIANGEESTLVISSGMFYMHYGDFIQCKVAQNTGGGKQIRAASSWGQCLCFMSLVRIS